MNKLKSRKFWVAFLVIILIALAKQLDLDVEQIKYIAGVALSFLVSQGWVDGRSAQQLGELVESTDVEVKSDE